MIMFFHVTQIVRINMHISFLILFPGLQEKNIIIIMETGQKIYSLW